jgi:aerobic carbon-monoxide dehydrogenase medium subunit
MELHTPRSVDEAIGLLQQYGDQAKIIAGDTAVVLMLKNRLISPAALIDVSRLAGLRYVEHAPGASLRLGGLTTLRAAECSAVVREHVPALASTFGEVASVRVRNAATVGGNLCEADYASDPPAMLVALRASIRAVSHRGEREIRLQDGFFKGFYETAMQPDEILTELTVPDLSPRAGAAYLKFVTRSSEDRPCLGVAAVVELDEHAPVCRDMRVVVGAVAETPQEVETAEAVARGQRVTDELVSEVAERYASAIDPISDLRGSEAYRKRMIRVFVRRAIQRALADVGSRTSIGVGGTV